MHNGPSDCVSILISIGVGSARSDAAKSRSRCRSWKVFHPEEKLLTRLVDNSEAVHNTLSRAANDFNYWRLQVEGPNFTKGNMISESIEQETRAYLRRVDVQASIRKLA